MRLKSLLEVLLLTLAPPLLAQVAPSASHEGQGSLSIGAGMSRFSPDMGSGSIYGETLWIGYSLDAWVPMLSGLGLELEARDIKLGRSPKATFLREDVGLAGVTYTVHHFRKVSPYAKFEVGLGNVDYLVAAHRSYHQSRTVTGFGGGIDYKASRALSLRLDYEYQYLPQFFLGTPAHPTSTPLDPQGFTLGAMYHFHP